MTTEEPPDNSPTFLGHQRDLHRHLSFWNSRPLASPWCPGRGLYAMGVQTDVTGGGWFVALAICLIMQLLVATVYAELASQFPIAGGAYKWAHHLGGSVTGQFAGVIYLRSTIAMLTTTAYTGGIWLAMFFESSSSSGLALVLWGGLFLAICMVLNVVHATVFKMTLSMGVYAEIVGSVGVALLLFLFFRQHTVGELFQHLEQARPWPDRRVSRRPRHRRMGLHRLRCLFHHCGRNAWFPSA